MSADENIALLHHYVDDVWNAGEPEAVARFAAPTFRRHTSAVGTALDLAGQIERLKGFRAAFPDVTIEIDDVLAGEDGVAFRSTMRGTHLGEFLGIPPTGRAVVVGLVDMIRIEDGRFMEQWGGPDLFDLLRQLGATVIPGE